MANQQNQSRKFEQIVLSTRSYRFKSQHQIEAFLKSIKIAVCHNLFFHHCNLYKDMPPKRSAISSLSPSVEDDTSLVTKKTLPPTSTYDSALAIRQAYGPKNPADDLFIRKKVVMDGKDEALFAVCGEVLYCDSFHGMGDFDKTDFNGSTTISASKAQVNTTLVSLFTSFSRI
jgi:hypothetical protein